MDIAMPVTIDEQLDHAHQRLDRAIERERLAHKAGDLDEVVRLGDIVLMCVNEIRTLSVQREAAHE